ncbi:hypothetical protein L596_017467 [Steinernema carpocapsae]|uniref:Autophagy-related protein 101 n=1 Tax=Steinernema carpocapsae TaxID=34508 RepID=A0A4U5N1R9_STECR|nr:hypothetical protein L596_017467 [Steinernema carpocapsae]
MNAITNRFHLTLEMRQVTEALQCFAHTVLYHRTLAKNDRSFFSEVGVLGEKEVKCNALDVFYVRTNSPELKWRLEPKIEAFVREVNAAAVGLAYVDRSKTTQSTDILSCSVKIEFFTKKKKSQWSFLGLGDGCSVWEIWELNMNIVKVTSSEFLEHVREKATEDLSLIQLQICSAMNKGSYVPKMLNGADFASIFDGSLSDCQPYHHRLSWPELSSSVQGSRLLKSSSSDYLRGGFDFVRKVLK